MRRRRYATLDERTPNGLEMDLSFEELSMLFALKGWLYGNRRGVPSPDDLYNKVVELVEALEAVEDDGRVLFAAEGRFLVYSDPEMPYSYDVYVYVGNVDRLKLDESQEESAA